MGLALQKGFHNSVGLLKQMSGEVEIASHECNHFYFFDKYPMTLWQIQIAPQYKGCKALTDFLNSLH